MSTSAQRFSKQQLIEFFAVGAKIHLKWARHQERCQRQGKNLTPIVGSAHFHRKWVKIYNETIHYLKHSAEIG